MEYCVFCGPHISRYYLHARERATVILPVASVNVMKKIMYFEFPRHFGFNEYEIQIQNAEANIITDKE